MNVCAIIVTFNPDLCVLEEMLSLLISQVQGGIIVDNSGNDLVKSWLNETGWAKEVNIITNRLNRGIGAAHNEGISWAAEQGFTHVLLMDHDSIPHPGMVAKLYRVMNTLISDGISVAAVGPKHIDPRSGQESFFVRYRFVRNEHIRCNEATNDPLPVDFLISSGCLISLNALEVIGVMDELLFIDHVDTEWFLRASAKGFVAVGVCDAVMEHYLGDDIVELSIMGRQVTFPDPKPERHYYVFRNSVLLYKRIYAPLRWIIADIGRLVCMMIFYSLTPSRRIERFKMMCKGLRDGALGKVGPLV